MTQHLRNHCIFPNNFSSKICFTLIAVLDHRSLKHLIASNYGEKYFSRGRQKQDEVLESLTSLLDAKFQT